jgi:hypothetical protein
MRIKISAVDLALVDARHRALLLLQQKALSALAVKVRHFRFPHPGIFAPSGHENNSVRSETIPALARRKTGGILAALLFLTPKGITSNLFFTIV